MGYLWLKYERGATSVERFRATRDTIDVETTRVEETGLRGIEYSHLTAARDVWSVVISPDELISDAKFGWLVEFWEARRWWISTELTYDEPLIGTFVEVVIPGGRMPVEYLGTHKRLRQVSFDARMKHSKSLA